MTSLHTLVEEAQHQNPVLPSTVRLAEEATHVTIDDDQIWRVAEQYRSLPLRIPRWDFAEYIPQGHPHEAAFFVLGNTQNFCYTVPGQDKWAATVNGKTWEPGSVGMWASLTAAVRDGLPLFNGEYLRDMPFSDVQQLFAGTNEIPLIRRRHAIFNEVGSVLTTKYDGRFEHLLDACYGKLFNNGQGLIERLVNEFPSFSDAYQVNGRVYVFNKRAQLAALMLAGRFQDNPLFDDEDKLTVCINYQIPVALRGKKITRYDEALARHIAEKEPILEGSQEEIEIRGASQHAAERLRLAFSELRGENVTNVQHDYFCWKLGRDLQKEGLVPPHHLTVTTRY